MHIAYTLGVLINKKTTQTNKSYIKLFKKKFAIQCQLRNDNHRKTYIKKFYDGKILVLNKSF